MKVLKKRSSWGFHGVEGFSVGPAEKNYIYYTGWIPTTGEKRISDTVVFFPPQKYTYELPAPPNTGRGGTGVIKSAGQQPQNVGNKQPNIHTFIKLFRITTNVGYTQLRSKKGFRQKDTGHRG